jgi:hypothetical protein
MKSILKIVLFTMISITCTQAQYSKLGASVGYSGAFISRGDMSGTSISMSIHYALKNRLTLNLGYHQINTDSGYGPEFNLGENNMLAFKYTARNLMGSGVLLSTNEVNNGINGFYNNQLYIGLYNSDSPERISTSNIMSIGLKYKILEGNKFSLTIGADVAVLQHEYIFESSTSIVNLKNQFADIENISNYPNTKLIIQEQGNFWDIGIGGNIFLGYRVHKNLILGPNLSCFNFVKSQIIMLSYGAGISLEF